MHLHRRDLLKLGLGVGGGFLLQGLRGVEPLLGGGVAPQAPFLRKTIPSSGESVPVIGLGTAQTFNLPRRHPDQARTREVIRDFHALGGTVIDTSPTYQRSEPFLGEAIREWEIQDELFLATKVNVGDRGRRAALRQMEGSARTLGKRTLDLVQVWNLGDSISSLSDRHLASHMEVLQEWKEGGRARHIGITTSRDRQYGDVEAAMERWELDVVQLDYSIGDRIPEQRLLPLALERGIAVIVNRPFATGNLFGRVQGVPLPPWAAEFDSGSWAQFFLKFIVAHPAVTCVVPATSNPRNLRDNMGAGRGRLPDPELRERMAEHVAALG